MAFRNNRGFLPQTDAELLAWSANFKSRIETEPSVFGLLAPQVDEYGILHDNFANALPGVDPGVRSKAAVATKNTARTALKARARLLAKIIEGQVNVTDTQKIELGLNVRKTPTPIPVPTESPRVDLVSIVGSLLTVRLHTGSLTTKARPAGVKGASIFTYVGENAPTQASQWTFWGSTSKTLVAVPFDPALAPGTKVWVTAFWFNTKAQSGPAAEPVSALIQFGGVMSTQPMKMAA